MKIGILTLPFNNNYGGYLQAFALMTVLKRFGYEVELINRRPNNISFLNFLMLFFKNLIKASMGRKIFSIKPNQEKEYLFKGRYMHSFVKSYICPMSNPLFSSKSLNHYINKKFDVVVVGSDQIWRPDYVSNIEDFFLRKVNSNVKKIAYAASFGCSNPKYSEKERLECGNAIKKFKSIGLREKQGCAIIEKMGWKCKSQFVLDPTMLLCKKDYEELFQNESSFCQNDLFVYVLDDCANVKMLVDKLTEKTKLRKKYIMDPVLWKNFDYQLPSIEKWLRGIYDSKMVITDSFHGMVFCIIFNKPFWVIINKDRGAERFESLLSFLHLENRMITNESDFDFRYNEDINWQNVNNVIEKMKIESINFLKEALTDE